MPKHARSACEPHREWIEKELSHGRNAMGIYQDLVEQFGFSHRYNSVKRFVGGLKRRILSSMIGWNIFLEKRARWT